MPLDLIAGFLITANQQGIDVTKEPRTYGRDFQLQGQAAVWQVASQLALRSHNVLFPGLDEGYDLQLDNGLRLQIKSAHLKIHGKSFQHPGYSFAIRRGAWDGLDKRYKRSAKRSYSEVADFFVLWAIDENRFFILPTKGAGQSIWFTHKGYESKSQNREASGRITKQRLAEMEERWDLLDINSVQEIVDSSTITFPEAGAYPVEFELKEQS